MVRLVDVAREAGVSISTASVVLNPSPNAPAVSPNRAARVREAAKQLGYRANYHARTMRTGRAMSIGFVVDTGPTGNLPDRRLGLSFFSTMLGGVEAAAAARGYCTVLFGSSPKRRAMELGIEAVEQRRVDGLVVCELGAADMTRRVIDRKVTQPLVFLGGSRVADNPYTSVGWSTQDAIVMAVDHLAGLGHRSFLWVAPDREGSSDEGAVRESVFLREMVRRGFQADCLHFDPNHPTPDLPAASGASRPPGRGERLKLSAAEALNDFLSDSDSKPFTAAICFNDVTAIGCVSALQSRGLSVPNDVSIVGIDDIEAAFCCPALTTVSHRLDELGLTAARRLLEIIDGGPDAKMPDHERIVLDPVLVIRDSTAAAAT